MRRPAPFSVVATNFPAVPLAAAILRSKPAALAVSLSERAASSWVSGALANVLSHDALREYVGDSHWAPERGTLVNCGRLSHRSEVRELCYIGRDSH